jgi:hypothetical protein
VHYGDTLPLIGPSQWFFPRSAAPSAASVTLPPHWSRGPSPFRDRQTASLMRHTGTVAAMLNMRRTRRVNWRLAPSVVKALEQAAEESGASASYLANYLLANCLRDKLGEIAQEEPGDKN